MHMTRILRNVLIAVLLIGFAAAAAMADDEKASNKWRIEVSEGANSDGTIRFMVIPTGGAETEVAVNIAKGRGENEVAHDIRDAVTRAVDPVNYKVEIDDGEDVLIKKTSDKVPDFRVVYLDSTVKSVRIKVERE
jgi:hypothetical protein